MKSGLVQGAVAYGTGANAAANLTNDGTIAIAANAIANATGEDAQAEAQVALGVVQFAYASDGDANATISNGRPVYVRVPPS